MLIARKKNSSRDVGLTLIEVLIAALITSIIGIAIMKVTSNASIILSRNTGEINANLEMMNLTRKIQFDFARSSDVFVHDELKPTSLIDVCASNTSWQSFDQNAKAFPINAVRPLFSIKINELGDTVTGNWMPSSQSWVGYEIRNTNSIHSLWRVKCALGVGASAAPSYDSGSDVKLLTFGRVLERVQEGSITSEPTGRNSLNCAMSISSIQRVNKTTTVVLGKEYPLPYNPISGIISSGYDGSTITEGFIDNLSSILGLSSGMILTKTGTGTGNFEGPTKIISISKSNPDPKTDRVKFKSSTRYTTGSLQFNAEVTVDADVDIQPPLPEFINGRYSVTIGGVNSINPTFISNGSDIPTNALTLDQKNNSNMIFPCPVNVNTNYFTFYQFRIPYISNSLQGNPYAVVKKFSTGNTNNDQTGLTKILIGTLERRIEVK